MVQSFDQLVEQVRELALVQSLESVVYWDHATLMPPRASDYRGKQLGFLAGLVHERRTSKAFEDALLAAESAEASQGYDERQRVQVKKIRRRFDLETKLDSSLVQKIAKAKTESHAAWKEAKQTKNFDLFVKPLTALLDLMRQKAQCYGHEGTLYDGLIQEFEWGTFSLDIDRIFNPLKESLVSLVSNYREVKLPDSAPRLVGQGLSSAVQEQLCNDVAKELGFGFDNGAMALSSHPFSITMGPDDYRITVRYSETELTSAFMAAIHEVGHSLYERGLPNEHWGTPLGAAVSAGVHESQSLFWENRVGRSGPFLDHWFDRFKAAFPDYFKGTTPEGFFLAMNQIRPDFIRVEADEVTYSLHIIARYEIEKALVNGEIGVKDIPGLWNEKYQSYLGITPPHDGVGCLQDIHWAEGLFGYFPSYALGHLMSAQFVEAYEAELGSLHDHIAAKDYERILGYFRKHVHGVGSFYDAPELITHVTGRPLDEKAFVQYVSVKCQSFDDLKN